MPNIKLNSKQVTTALLPLSHRAIGFVKQGKFPVNIRENKFTMRVNTGAGAQGGCGVSTLEILKIQLCKTLSNLLYLDLLCAGVG